MNEIDNLSIGIQAKCDSDVSKIDKLTNSLSNLKKIIDSGLSSSLNELENLRELTKIASFESVSKDLNKLTNSLNKLKNFSFQGFSSKINTLTNNLVKLGSIDTSFVAMGQFATNSNKMVNSLNKLEQINLENIANKIIQLTNYLKPLTDECLRGGNAVGNYANILSKVNSISNSAAKSTKSLKVNVSNLFSSFAKFSIIKRTINQLAQFSKELVDETASWVENLNLFAVTFGEGEYQEILDWATDLADAFGTSYNEIVKYTGLFKQLATSIGVVSETGTAMSQTLTQIAYDISSFYNISIQSAMEKLQAGIFSGQTKPLRSVGIDVTYQSIDNLLQMNNALKQFNTSSKQLSQSQKTIARTILVLQSAQNAMGDTADTITSLENSIKILKGSVDNLKLALGDVFRNTINDLIIYVSGLVIGITNIIRAFKQLDTQASQDLGNNNLLADINEEIEDIQNNLGLLSFDKFESLTKSTNGENENLDITEALTSELQKQQELYNEIFNTSLQNIQNKATEIGKTISEWALDIDSNGFVKLNDVLSKTITIIEALVATALIDWTSKSILSLIEMAKAASISSSALATLSKVGIFALVYSIIELVKNWDNLSDGMRAAYVVLGSLGGVIAIFSNTTMINFIKKIYESIVAQKALVNQQKLVKTSTMELNAATMAANIGFMAIGATIGLLIGEQLTKLPRDIRTIIGVLSTLIGVALVAAYAFGALQSSMTLGVAAATIVAGIVAISSAIKEYKNQISEVQYKAKGGTFDLRGGDAIGVVNEYGKDELVYSNSSKQIEVSNQESLKTSFKKALEEWSREQQYTKEQQDIVIQMDGREVGRGAIQGTIAGAKQLGLKFSNV